MRYVGHTPITMSGPLDSEHDRSRRRTAAAVTAAMDGATFPSTPMSSRPAGPTAGARRRPSGRTEPRVLLAVSLGAMGGAAARYKLATWITAPAGGFPWATFWTNVSGSFVLGVLLARFLERFPPTRYARAFAGTGFLGAYTTFSTFSVETDVLLKDGHAAIAAIYVVSSLVVGLTLAWSGVLLGRLVSHRRPARAPRRYEGSAHETRRTAEAAHDLHR